MGLQYEKLLLKENFELAFSRIKHAPNNAYKWFYNVDIESFDFFLGSNIEQLINDIKEFKYEPKNVHKYYIPKKNNLARPISLLDFVDLLVYQAIANIVMDEVKDGLSVTNGRVVFANVINSDKENAKFFQFENWRVQWKKYQKCIKTNFKEGYVYIAEFDIASFYDTINHNILIEILRQKGIEDDILLLLNKCLSKWSISLGESKTFAKQCGIPQGPECSGLFADLYLREIDNLVNKNLKEVKYLRYVDDIKIMARTETDCQKCIALLDFYCKDLSLLAQSSKIGIKLLDAKNINNYINAAGLNLSNFANEYKKFGEISEKSHNKIKRKLLQTFDKDNELHLDKTILKFAFFKLNKDDQIKDLIIANWDLLYLTFEGPIYYLNKYYDNDSLVMEKIHKVLLSEDVLFQYNKAIIFDKFKSLPFYEDVYESLVKNKANRFWIVKYFAIDWLKSVDKVELIKYILPNQMNYFTQQKILLIDINNASSAQSKNLIAKLNYGSSTMLALCAFKAQPIFSENLSEDSTSDFILNICKLGTSNYVSNYFKQEYSINKCDSQKFIKALKKDKDVFYEATRALMNFKESLNSNYPDRALEYLDLFHNIIVDLMLSKVEGNFGSKIEEIKDIAPYTHNSFKLIHEARSQKTAAHYKDKALKVRKVIDKKEFDELIKKANLNETYEEVCLYFENNN